jgi:hypothetical protein
MCLQLKILYLLVISGCIISYILFGGIMKKLFKVGITALALVAMLGAYGFSAEKETKTGPAEPKTEAAAEGDEDSGTGLSIGLTYYSNYLWRGTYFYGGEGAFCPNLSWEIFSTGLTLSVAGEFAADYFFEGNGRDSYGFDYHSFDAGLDYEHTFADLVTIGAGIWYYYYFNSEKAIGTDASMLIVNASIGFEVILNPFIAFNYDYYVDEHYCEDNENDKDFYIQAGIGHDFEITPEVTISLGLTAGYYHAMSIHAFGISDVDTSVGLSFTKGVLTMEGAFHYVAVPMKDFYEGDDIHRWYASFGTTVSF